MHVRRMPSQSNVLMYTINTSWREPTLTAESSPSPLAMALGSTGQENKGEGEEGGRKEGGRGEKGGMERGYNNKS